MSGFCFEVSPDVRVMALVRALKSAGLRLSNIDGRRLLIHRPPEECAPPAPRPPSNVIELASRRRP